MKGSIGLSSRRWVAAASWRHSNLSSVEPHHSLSLVWAAVLLWRSGAMWRKEGGGRERERERERESKKKCHIYSMLHSSLIMTAGRGELWSSPALCWLLLKTAFSLVGAHCCSAWQTGWPKRGGSHETDEWYADEHHGLSGTWKIYHTNAR